MDEWRAKLQTAMDWKKGHEERVAERRAQAETDLEAFLLEVVRPAFAEIKPEFERYGRTIKIDVSKYGAHFTVSYNSAEEFSFSLRPTYCDSFLSQT